MRWEFHPEALEEYRETTFYYAERDPGLALRFVEAVEDTIRRILESPEHWRVLDEDVRRCLTRVFPYGVLYPVPQNALYVSAGMNVLKFPKGKP